MPFAQDFDDVYETIKQAVESATRSEGARCFRLDESRPAGRITDRLLGELKSATFCIADVTGTTSNVMWELGFVMALGKPVIIVTQSSAELPFDIRDMQKIEYQRGRLTVSLAAPLKRVVLDTIGGVDTTRLHSNKEDQQSEVIGILLDEVTELKKIVSEVVGEWKKSEPELGATESATEVEGLVGHWLDTESNSHFYSELINGELVTPYCFDGNEALTGIYFGWKRIGDYWFARYQWVGLEISGFAFHKPDSPDSIVGAWWLSEHEDYDGMVPPAQEGRHSRWVRLKDSSTPYWAKNALKEIKGVGVANYLRPRGESTD